VVDTDEEIKEEEETPIPVVSEPEQECQDKECELA